MDIKIGQKGTEVIFPAGYLNRERRRKLKKLYRGQK